MSSITCRCPECSGTEIRQLQRLKEVQTINGWEIDPSGFPMPSSFGAIESVLGSAEPYGFDCAKCGAEFDIPRVDEHACIDERSHEGEQLCLLPAP